MELGQDSVSAPGATGGGRREPPGGVRSASGRRKDAAKNLARGLASKMRNGASRVDGRSQLAPALLWMDQHAGPGDARTSVLGAAMLQTIVKFPRTPRRVRGVAREPRAARSRRRGVRRRGQQALEAFLASAERKPKLSANSATRCVRRASARAERVREPRPAAVLPVRGPEDEREHHRRAREGRGQDRRDEARPVPPQEARREPVQGG